MAFDAIVFDALSTHPPAAAWAAIGTRNSQPVLRFIDATTSKIAVFRGLLPNSYAGGGITVDLYWMAATATTGNVKWNVEIERDQVGTLDHDADSFAAAQTVTEACAGTSGATKKSSIAFTSGAQMDSLAAGEPFRVRVTRDIADAADTMVGNAELAICSVRET